MNINATVVYYSILNCSRARPKKQKNEKQKPKLCHKQKIIEIG